LLSIINVKIHNLSYYVKSGNLGKGKCAMWHVPLCRKWLIRHAEEILRQNRFRRHAKNIYCTAVYYWYWSEDVQYAAYV